MSLAYPYGVGLGNVGSYQVSGVPYTRGKVAAPANSGTPTQIVFPDVTQRIIVSNINTAAPLRVGFSSNGVKTGGNFFVLPPATANVYPTAEFRVKVSELYLLSDTGAPTSGSIFAELSNIETTLLANSGPNGSSWSGSDGVG
jgi:hypothetical protein